MTASSSQIAGRITAARDAMAEIEVEIENLSLPAASGEQDALDALRAAHGRLDAIERDVAILERARSAAARAEFEASQEATSATRARHRADAREHATRLLTAGERAEEMIVAFRACLEEMAEAERAIHASLRASGEPLSVGISGRYNIAATALERLTAACSGRLPFMSDQRSVPAILGRAWADLKANEND